MLRRGARVLDTSSASNGKAMNMGQRMTEVAAARRRAFFGSLGLLSFASVYAQVVVIPVLTEIAYEFDVSEGNAVIVVAAFGVPGVIVPMLAGPLTDRHARKPFLVCGALLVLCGALLSTMASTFCVLVVGRVISGAGAWLTFPSAYATIADGLPYRERGRAISTNMSIGTLASVAGIPMSGLIAEATSWRLSVGLVGMISLFSAAAVLLFVPSFQPRPEARQLGELFGSIAANRSVITAFTSSFLGASSWFVWSSFVVVFFQVRYALTLGVASVLSVTVGLGLMVGTLLGGRLGDRFGQKHVMVAAAMGACPLVLTLTNLPMHLAAATLLNLLMASAMGARFAATNTLLSEQVPEARGTVLAIAVSTVSIALVVSAALGGILLDGFGFGVVGATGAALALCSALTAAAFVNECSPRELGRTWADAPVLKER